MRGFGLAEVAEVHLQPIEIIGAEVLRRLRKFARNPLKTLRRFCGRKSPHTPLELPQRINALRSSFDQATRRGRPPARATRWIAGQR